MKEIKAQLDKVETQLDSINITLAKNTVLLDEHIRRTNILEEEIKPVKDHVKLVNALAKVVTGGGALAVILKQLGLF